MPTDRPILLDNTVLTNFALLGEAALVLSLWPDRVASTPQVLAEYGVAAHAGLLPADAWEDLPVIELTPHEVALAAAYAPRLGRGECSCLAMAHARGGLLASDDADARAVATRLSIPVTGTLGLLALAVRRGLLTLNRANAMLASLVVAGYRSPLDKLDSLV